MKAMVLAAGLGTRLAPLTIDRPKALVEIGGRTMLEIALERLRSFAIREVIVNVHHFADQIVDYLAAHKNFGMEIAISRERVLLDTGGGLKQAGWFFHNHGTGREPFLVHNVDVVSTIDFNRMVKFHHEHGALATLAVQKRKTTRYLLFDEKSRLCGRRSETGDGGEFVRPVGAVEALAFCGIHVISPRLIPLMSEQGAFSIIATYLRLAGHGEEILGFSADEFYWCDLGKAENVARAERELKQRTVLQ
ncbi:MAG: nucleotidyltransferase family protein [Acidobacteria bacterium]|nr:nucleotidyltransferase family protein [Acidobacteriota bacterium]